MQLVDIGANLTHSSFHHDLDAVLERARAQGVSQLVVTGASRDGSPQALALAQAHPGLLYATAGVHPHHAGEYDGDCDALLRELVAAPEVRAVGETGLDYFRDLSTKIDKTLKNAKVDPYTQAHLSEAKVRIDKALDAQYIYNTDDINAGGGMPFMFFGEQAGAPGRGTRQPD